ncbi:MAG: 30S ribosomal protein S4 [Spirochaetales bacterium]|uniref:Small ribosomal subunit protein uS4 n=1 Tax=Candidatus Thalassospirochaeta sargassi TaxID=3119039 RepID=A0AAJ1MPG4_9SPIO|nr:30S ribosomal protein S4 [Spirochaetales bacterium]
MPYKKAPRGKLTRKFGINVFGNPKFDKILKRKPNGPGKPSGKKQYKKTSNYGTQLLEKQKIRYTYGLSEKQFRNTFFKAKKKVGVTSENFILLLESRLDNLIYRMGWAVSREQSKQMVNHGYFRINNKKADIPSMTLKPGDRISVRGKENIRTLIRYVQKKTNSNKPTWLKVDPDNLEAELISSPEYSSIQPAADLQAVIEYYSR